jgi:hypothetical protein
MAMKLLHMGRTGVAVVVVRVTNFEGSCRHLHADVISAAAYACSPAGALR